MSKIRWLFNSLIALILTFSLLAASTGSALAKKNDPPKADPRLLQMAEENPDAIFMVIVQREVKNKNAQEDDPETEVEKGGGKVGKNFKFIESFSAELTGKEILKLAKKKKVRWISVDAPMFSTAVVNQTVRDEFATASYSNNNGSQSWSGAWIEVDGAGAGPTAGNALITGGKLSLDDQPDTSGQPSLAREVNLSDSISATLSFSFQTTGGVDTNDSAVVEISANGGASYTMLENFTGISGATSGSRSYNIAAFASNNTRIRFRINNLYGGSDETFLVDNVQIEYAQSVSAPTPAPTGTTVRDEFATASYSNNSGSQSWSGAWIEVDGAGAGPTAGNALVTGGELSLDDQPDTSGQPSLAREANLSGSISATLSFSFRTTSGVDTNDSAVVEISANGGASYTQLEDFTGIAGATADTRSYNIAAFASNNTRIRFRINNLYGGSDETFLVDDVQIEYALAASTPPAAPTDPPAPMPSTNSPGMETVRDEFNSVAFNGSNGTKDWSQNPWIEIGESNGPASGDVEVDIESGRCVSGYCLELEGDNATQWGAYRKVNLQGAVSVTLTFAYKRFPESSTSSNIEVQVSSDGGTSWTKLDTIPITATDTAHQFAQYDLSPYANENTHIRFISYAPADAEIHIDNVEISFAYPSAFVSAIKADQLSNLNGSGVTVAVIDSGITTSHPDLKTGSTSRVIANTKFGSYLTTTDVYGHGTHVAGTIGGNGGASNGKYKGVAPGVNLVNVKVSDDYGMTRESDLVAGLQWVYDNKDTYNIRVVNISLNSTMEQSYHTSPLDAAVEILWFNGIVVVVSAGNNGTADGPSTLYPPANDPFVITVGATEDKGTPDLSDDNLAVFSAYGTTIDGFAKPDLVAPGRNVVAPLGGLLNIAFKLHPRHRVNDNYFRMSGTSMAAPVVSGAVALLLQDEPNLNPDQVKYRLMATANQNNWYFDDAQAGAGYLDAYAAVSSSTDGYANQGITPSQMLATGDDAIAFDSVGWNSVGWNSVGWNSVGWNSVGWNSVGWNSVGWNSVGWNSLIWDD